MYHCYYRPTASDVILHQYYSVYSCTPPYMITLYDSYCFYTQTIDRSIDLTLRDELLLYA